MAEGCTVNIECISFAVTDIICSKGRIFKNILGVDWCVSAKLIKKLKVKKSPSIHGILCYSNRIRVTLRCEGLQKMVLAKIKTSPGMQHPNMKDMIFDYVSTMGSNSISSELTLDSDEDYDNWISFNGEFSLYVSPENFFYYKFPNNNSFLEEGVTQSIHIISRELVNDFSELYKNQRFADAEIRCGDKVFKAHKVILTSRSPVFASMFQHRMVENVIVIEDVGSKVLSIMLEFIYCGKIDGLSMQTAGGLLLAADQYQLTSLKKVCLSFLQCVMCEVNVLSTLSLADLHEEALKNISIDFVRKEFDHLKETEQWKTFQREKPLLSKEFLLNVIGYPR